MQAKIRECYPETHNYFVGMVPDFRLNQQAAVVMQQHALFSTMKMRTFLVPFVSLCPWPMMVLSLTKTHLQSSCAACENRRNKDMVDEGT